MIKSLSNIRDISVIEQNGYDDILSFSKLDFDDTPLGSGAFGTVYKVKSIDGVQKSEYVVKLFTDENSKDHAYDVIKILHDKLKRHQQKTKQLIYHDIPELLGLPFMVFKAYDNISEKECIAFLMYNLDELGYQDYGSDSANLQEYKTLELPSKLYLAYQLSKIIDFLHKIEFIHADLSENSLWFNAKRIQLSIIDFDSGYHFDTQGKPTTIGKIGHWIGSAFRNIIGQQKDSSNLTTLDRLYEEYWVLANAIFEIIFGVMPFFFLSDSDDTTKLNYLKKFEWPNIDYNSPLFNQENIEQHKVILAYIEQLENAGAQQLIKSFKQVFNKGYKSENKRLTSQEWKEVLKSLNEVVENNPSILDFTSDKKSIKYKNEEVEFLFDIQKFNSVYIDNQLISVLNKNRIFIPIQDEKNVILKVINDFGEDEKQISIKALKTNPKIIKFEASTLFRNTIEPIKLLWDTENVSKVTISDITETFEGRGEFDVEPTALTKYVLTATGYFDEVVTSELTIDVISPKIKLFTWEINLNEGIDNVDIKWETEDAQSVEITPKGVATEPKGLAHIPISKETTFKLVAKGLFNQVEKEIIAHPFPVPIVKQIFAEAPKIELNTNFNSKGLELSLLNTIHFDKMETDLSELKSTLKSPDFETENKLIEKYSKNKISFSDIYESVLEKIHKKLSI